jgi:pyruvate/2-oxoglutarate/acetoin dehydrogenase E1 component
LSKKITYIQAINDAMHLAMDLDHNVICFGLGVDDPKTIFGSTKGLQNRFGSERVFDMPTSENAMTGVAIGAALNGVRPVMVHQRLDFFLLAMDQLVNNAAKWHYMFGGQRSVPITIRLILGRGWGQGPTHSQSLQAWFAHIPGLKVVMPTSAEDAKGLLLASIFDDNPVLFLEHRWLHNTLGEVPSKDYRIQIGSARVLRKGKALTIVAMSYMVIEAIHAVDYLLENGIDCELIDPRTISPMDWNSIFSSLRKTGRLLVLDTGSATGSVAGEIITRAVTECWEFLKSKPMRIAMPDFPEPTSFGLTLDYYPSAESIIDVVNQMLGTSISKENLIKLKKYPHDIPGTWFQGPF